MKCQRGVLTFDHRGGHYSIFDFRFLIFDVWHHGRPHYRLWTARATFYRLLFACLLWANGSFAQSDTLQTQQLKAVVVTSTRIETSLQRLPMSVSVLDASRLKMGNQGISLFESLGNIAGLFAQNPDNYAQDLRLSIRGFGARAAFGIRGIRLIVDGIPESTPDGQADIDNIDPSLMQRMEVLKGAASSMYGNAAGGVVALQTDDPANTHFLEAQYSQGSYGYRGFRLKAALQKTKWSALLSLSNNQSEGYRRNADYKATILNFKTKYQFDARTYLSLLVNYGSNPVANDPGGLTAAQAATDRQQAQPNNLLFKAGEAVNQGRVGLIFEKQKGRHLFYSRAFFTSRAFTNFLAFQNAGAGSIDRNFGGWSTQYQFSEQFKKLNYKFRIGIDFENQADTRRRFNNLNGLKDKQTFGQVENFANVATFITQEIAAKKWTALLGLRADKIRQSVEDQFLSDGNQSGERNFNSVNPSLGFSYFPNKHFTIYSNIASSFETPTMSELSNNPTGIGGFNPDLNPQRSLSRELGFKYISKSKTTLEMAVFWIDVKQELVAYQLAGQAGRVFYRNAGNSVRKGIEVSNSFQFKNSLTWTNSLTISDFKYKNYVVAAGDFGGKVLPGIPANQWATEVRYTPTRFFYASLQAKSIGQLFADDANANAVAAYKIINLKIGLPASIYRWWVEPYLGINNVTNTVYFQNVQINATAGRFFEPAVGRYIYGGIKVAFD